MRPCCVDFEPEGMDTLYNIRDYSEGGAGGRPHSGAPHCLRVLYSVLVTKQVKL